MLRRNRNAIASITAMKTRIKSTISTESARHYSADIKEFYLNSKLNDYGCLLIDGHLIPPQFTQDCNLSSITKNGKVLVEIRKGMNGLNKMVR